MNGKYSDDDDAGEDVEY